MTATEQLPPHDLDAEAGALGCLLHGDPNTGRLIGELTDADFYDLRHQKIYATIRALRDAGESIQPITVQRRLNGEGSLTGYISDLPDKTPSPENFPVYLKLLQHEAARREMLRFSVEFKKAAASGSDPRDAFNFLESAFRAAGDRRKISDLPPIVDAGELVTTPHEKPKELIAGILHEGSKLVLGGGSKSCKTWVLADMALSVAHGAPWISLPTVQRKVLFLNFEIQEAFFADRLRVIASAKGLKIKAAQLDIWNLRGRSADASILFPKIKSRIYGRDYGLVILDPVYKLYGQTDENSAGDVARLLNQIEDLAVSTGAAVAFGAHFSKGNQAAKEAIDRVSGSGVFARDPDSLLMLTALKDKFCYALESVLRNFPPMDPFGVRFEFPLMARDGALDPADLKQPGGRKRAFEQDDLLELLEAELTSKEWQEAAEENGISERTFYRIQSELRRAGKVLKSKVSGKWAVIRKAAA